MREAFVDANVLLRYLTDEPRELADRAIDLLQAAEQARVPLVITPITLAEVAYVLQSVYGWQRQAIAERLLALLTMSDFTFNERTVVTQALLVYRSIPSLSFDDSYLAALAVSHRAGLISFDRDLRRVAGLDLVETPEQIRRG